MTARIIALSVLMAELCSTSPLLAASPVRLSLSNATDYATIVVVNTNLLKGIGMGAGGAYTTLRAEDITFLQEALTERLLLAPGTWMTIFGGREESGMVPRELTVWRHWYEDWPDVIAKESAWPISFSNEAAFPVNSGYAGRGFVPSSFALWTGGARSASTNAWMRNGYDAASDIRAVFSDDSRLFPTNELPSIPTFDGVPDFATMTNAYALLDSPYVRTALYVEEPLKSRCAYTNIIDAVNNYDSVVSNQYTQYQIPGTGDYGRYMSGYTATNVTYSTTDFSRGSMDALYWYAEHEIHLDTPWSVEYTSADRHGGKVHALAPYKETDLNSTTLPDSGTAWRLKVQLQRGWDGNGQRLYNTNLVVSAYAVLALKCTSTTTERRDYAIPELPSTTATSNLVRNVTVCLDIGELTMVGGAANGWEAATTPFDVAQTFRTAIAYAEIAGAWDHRLFPQVPISNPVVCDPNDYPKTTTSSSGGTGRGVSIHSHTMQCVKIYFILLVSPTYHARVLDD